MKLRNSKRKTFIDFNAFWITLSVIRISILLVTLANIYIYLDYWNQLYSLIWPDRGYRNVLLRENRNEGSSWELRIIIIKYFFNPNFDENVKGLQIFKPPYVKKDEEQYLMSQSPSFPFLFWYSVHSQVEVTNTILT